VVVYAVETANTDNRSASVPAAEKTRRAGVSPPTAVHASAIAGGLHVTFTGRVRPEWCTTSRDAQCGGTVAGSCPHRDQPV